MKINSYTRKTRILTDEICRTFTLFIRIIHLLTNVTWDFHNFTSAVHTQVAIIGKVLKRHFQSVLFVPEKICTTSSQLLHFPSSEPHFIQCVFNKST